MSFDNTNFREKDGAVLVGTRPTTDSEYLRKKEEERTQKQKRRKDENDKLTWFAKQKRNVRVRNIRETKKTMLELRSRGHGAKGLAKTVRAGRATIAAATSCFMLYLYQIGFWMLFLIGVALEAELGASDLYEMGAMTSLFIWSAKLVLPEHGLLASGWIISSVIGLMQLSLTAVIYTISGVNVFKGKPLIALGIIFTFTMMPLGIIPWAYIYMYFVFSSNQTLSK